MMKNVRLQIRNRFIRINLDMYFYVPITSLSGVIISVFTATAQNIGVLRCPVKLEYDK
jgi:hypothetical protein